MTPADKQKLLKTNALIWIGAMCIPALVILAIRMTDGRVSTFILAIVVVVSMWGLAMASNSLLSKAVGPPSDDETAPRALS